VWAGFLASGSFYLPRLPIHHLDSGNTRGVRQRLQRRDRNGVTPFSLLSYAAPASLYQRKMHGLLQPAQLRICEEEDLLRLFAVNGRTLIDMAGAQLVFDASNSLPLKR
jgi:hypothetical protein